MWQLKVATAVAAVSLFALGFALPALADEPAPAPVTAAPAAPAPNMIQAHQLLDYKIVNGQGQDLGKLYDIVLAPNHTRIAYVAVATGGVLGVGEKLHAIPMFAFEIRPDARHLVLNLDKKELENSPAFDKNNWPERGDRAFLKYAPKTELPVQVRPDMTHEERAAAPVSKDQLRYQRVRELLGLKVENTKNESLGKIDNLVFDQHGRLCFVAYGIIDLGASKLAAVPWNAIKIQPSDKLARLDTTRNTLDSVAFEKSKYPDLASREYATNLSQKFNTQPYWQTYGYSGEGRERVKMGIEAWKSDSDYNKKFDADKITTVEGTITQVSTFEPAPNAVRGVLLTIRTDDGKTLTVHAGPRPFLHREGFMFKMGDKVKVTGSDVTIDNQPVILATQIVRDNKTLDLRDKTGKPMWKADELSAQMEKMNHEEMTTPQEPAPESK